MTLGLWALVLVIAARNPLTFAEDWIAIGGDRGCMRYSTLDQIDTTNVNQMEVAWDFRTGELAEGKAKIMECTPLVVDGILYFTSGQLKVFALDAASGKEIWRFDPFASGPPTNPLASGGVNRGVAYWSDGKPGGKRRIFHGTSNGQLFSLDARTGKLDAAFGSAGVKDLREDLDVDVSRTGYGPTSAPAILDDIVIVGFSCGEGPGPSAPGDIRAFDAHTGKQLWRFHTVPRPDEFGNETWQNESWKNRGAANAWGGYSVDTERGLVFAGLGSAAFDFYGGDRPGDNLFANCTIALDGRTGERVWHFQTLHHDLWDHDIPTYPNLVTVKHDGNAIDAVAQVTKTGYVFLFDRESGKPLFEVKEVPVPASSVSSEHASPTQPVPVKPPPFSRIRMHEDEVTDIAPANRKFVLEKLKTLRGREQFTPPSLEGTVVLPGFHGGATWSGASFDPETSMLYVNSNNQPNIVTLVEDSGNRYGYRTTGYNKFLDQEGYPAIKPPWGQLTAIDLNRGVIAWQSTLGEYPELTARGIPQTGTENFGGTIVTAGGLVFIGGTRDERFHAFDKETGELLWETKLPAGGYATPSTYSVNDRQFVVIPASGGGKLGTPTSDHLIAFALPEKGSDNAPEKVAPEQIDTDTQPAQESATPDKTEQQKPVQEKGALDPQPDISSLPTPSQTNNDNSRYQSMIAAAEPVAYWSFSNLSMTPDIGVFDVTPAGNLQIASGPRPNEYPLFSSQNTSLDLGSQVAYLRVADPGVDSALDFDIGDTLAVEAWVAPQELPNGSYAYIIGKGRTFLQQKGLENHNWALRLKGAGSGASLSFLFRSQSSAPENVADASKAGVYHRWSSTPTFAIGDGWHHVALNIQFGKTNSLRAFIDGKPVGGKWDLGGDTEAAPVVDDDEVWIGSSMGGNRGSSFQGAVDEIAIYRHPLSSEEVAKRFRYRSPDPAPVNVPPNRVLVQLFQGVESGDFNSLRGPRLLEEFDLGTFAFQDLPKRYSQRGIQIDRPSPFMLRAYADIQVPDGPYRLLFRARERARVFLDDELLGETDPYNITVIANGPIWELDRSHGPNILPLQRGDRQQVVELQGDGKRHRLRFETFAGLGNRRPELGEALVAIAGPTGDFSVLTFGDPIPLTDPGWFQFCEENRHELNQVNFLRRREAGRDEDGYWQQRHEYARNWVRENLPADSTELSIDDFVVQELKARKLDRTARLTDLQFLRKATLDTLGRIPSFREIQEFQKDAPESRRSAAIARLLDSPEWADHWVPYWQDVLAENPNIVNPSLNNTGPFRDWIYESFYENKPMDRFVSELVRMEGSERYGGPAGFGLATENDVPMAAKAHVLGQAFLGVQMKCARCHDAPAHDVQQRDLFALAAMLDKKPVAVPNTSSIVLPPEELEQMAVEVTLLPGEKVAPEWTFNEFMTAPIPDSLLPEDSDSRVRLAALMTMPQNDRFAKVMVNRVWHRMLGRGLVEPVEDWEDAVPSHPELLNWLAKEFMVGGYDLKRIAALIMESELYQRASTTEMDKAAEYFAGPTLRKLTAEQLVDSLFTFSGKAYNAGPMAIDIDGARPGNLSLNLGNPRRAWMFSATSNERDRPSLAMPFAQPFITFLEQFGWRGARQNPINVRPDDSTAMQPAEFANGILVRRATRISDDHAILQIALEPDIELSDLVDQLYLRTLTRYPTAREQQIVLGVLTPGFDQRLVEDAADNVLPLDRRGMVSWSVHLEEVASEIKIALQDVVRRGDPATQKLESNWREQLEDVIWSILNAPEFRFSL